MADTPAAPVAAVPAPAAPASAPVVPTDPASSTQPIATKAPGIADLKAARRAATPAIDATPPPAAPVTTTTAEPPPPKATATIEMDEGALKQFSTLSRELREAKAKAKDLEAKVAGFGKFEKAQALAKEGKHYDAAREAGIDVDAALAELLGNNNGAPASAAQIDKKLREEIDELKAFKNDTVKEREERKKAEAEATTQADRAATTKFVADNAAKYPFLAKSPKLVALAYTDFEQAKAKVEAESGETMSASEQAKLMVTALQVHEEDWSKALGAAKTEEPPAEGLASGLGAEARSGVRQQATPTAKKLTWEELKAERAAKRSAQRSA